MSIKQYEYLVALAETGSFLKAAKRCCIGQPTPSIQIKKLEQTLGVIIFDRSRQPVTFTEIGQPALEQVRVVLEHVNVLKSIANRRTPPYEQNNSLEQTANKVGNLTPGHIKLIASHGK
jgi:LysR family hydrogen peroxide-inducible transcriptional activator